MIFTADDPDVHLSIRAFTAGALDLLGAVEEALELDSRRALSRAMAPTPTAAIVHSRPNNAPSKPGPFTGGLQEEGTATSIAPAAIFTVTGVLASTSPSMEMRWRGLVSMRKDWP